MADVVGIRTVDTLCLRGRRDSLQEYVEDLRWDGRLRIGRFAVDYLGSEDTPYARAVGVLWLWGMVARARRPGCKFDYMIVLEGKQGVGKSTALRNLVGDERFGEGQFFNLNDQRRAEALRGKWVYEVGELTGMATRDVNQAKMVISQQSDEGRKRWPGKSAHGAKWNFCLRSA